MLYDQVCMPRFIFYRNNRVCLLSKFCYRTTDERPSEFIKKNKDVNISATLKNAEPILHESITTFSKLRQEVWAEITNTDSVSKNLYSNVKLFLWQIF